MSNRSLFHREAVRERKHRFCELHGSLWKQVPPSCFARGPVAVFCKTDVIVIMQTNLTSLIACVSSSLLSPHKKRFDCCCSSKMVRLHNVCYNHTYNMCLSHLFASTALTILLTEELLFTLFCQFVWRLYEEDQILSVHGTASTYLTEPAPHTDNEIVERWDLHKKLGQTIVYVRCMFWGFVQPSDSICYPLNPVLFSFLSAFQIDSIYCPYWGSVRSMSPELPCRLFTVWQSLDFPACFHCTHCLWLTAAWCKCL